MVSVVIPAYNEEKLLGACLTSLVEQKTSQIFEVIVVDNNSTDKTHEIAKSFQNKLTLRIVSEKMQSRGAARAAGFSVAQGDIILSTDADVILPESWIEEIIKPFRDPHVVVVRGIPKVVEFSPIKNLFISWYFLMFIFAFRVLKGYWSLPGYNAAIRKDIYIRSKGFKTLNSQEDVELGMRLHKFGKIFLLYLPVIISGRRFKKGFIKVLLVYFMSVSFLFSKKPVDLNNIR